MIGKAEWTTQESHHRFVVTNLTAHGFAEDGLEARFSPLAYLLLERLRTVGLAGTQTARATVGSIRLHVLKVAAEITISVRRVHVRLSTAWPGQAIFRECAQRLAQSPLWSG